MRQGSAYLCKDSKYPLTDSQVLSLRNLLLSVPAYARLPALNDPARDRILDQLEIGPRTTQAHLADLARVVHVERVPDDLMPSLAWPKVRNRALSLVTSSGCTSGYEFSVTLNGTPTIRVFASGDRRPYMLPWGIEVDGKARYTVETSVPLKLAELFGRDVLLPELLDGRKYWKHDFWRDERVWADLQEQCDQQQAQRLSQRLRQAAPLLAEFLPQSVQVQLGRGEYACMEGSPRPSSTFTKVECIFSLDPDGVPRPDPIQIAGDYRLALQRAESFDWLREWRECGVFQTAQLTVFPATRTRRPDESHWKACGLTGKPTMEVFLKGPNYTCLSVNLSIGANVAVISTFRKPVACAPFRLAELLKAQDFEGHYLLEVDRAGNSRWHKKP